jgi:3D (Asp-Asp-Asp) domain-containing protein
MKSKKFFTKIAKKFPPFYLLLKKIKEKFNTARKIFSGNKKTFFFEIKNIINIAAYFISIIAIIFLLSKVLSTVSFTRDYILIFADGQIRTVYSYKSIPLKTILEALDIRLEQDDIASQDINKPVVSSLHAGIIKVRNKKRTISQATPYRVIWSRIYGANLRKTQLQKGEQKWIKSTVLDVFYNDKLYKSEILNEKTMELVYYRLILLDDKDEAETYYDLYKFKTLKMISTAYYAGDPFTWGDGKTTLLGHKMQRGIIAVDPKVIPLRTRVFIPGYGYGYAGDTGNAIKGNRVDLGVNDSGEEKAWAFRNVTVYLLQSSNTW